MPRPVLSVRKRKISQGHYVAREEKKKSCTLACALVNILHIFSTSREILSEMFMYHTQAVFVHIMKAHWSCLINS